jgi:rubrerythrin
MMKQVMQPMIEPMTRVRCRSSLARWFAVLALGLVLTGCGASLLYERLDTLVGFYIEGLVTLDDAQSAQLSRTLSRNLDWHRQAELGRYDASLQRLAAAVADGTTPDELDAAIQRAEDYWRDIFEQAAPGYTSLAVTLTDAQVRELLQNLAREDEKQWREYAERTPAERRARREKSLRKNIERFTGPLTATQLVMVREYAAQDRSFMPQWRENRRIWRAVLADALRDRAATPQFTARMHQLIARPDDLWTPEYRRAVDQGRTAFIDMLVSLDGTLTSRQRTAVQQELLALAREVRSLARSPG